MADFDTSSYPKAGPPQNPLDNLLKVGQVADTLGNIEAGKAVQGAIQDDGSIDRNALAQSLKGSVAGSMKAIPTLDAFEKLRSAGHVADMAGMENFQKRMAITNHFFGQLAAMDNPTIQDVNSIAARVLDPALKGAQYGFTFPVVMNALRSFRGPDGRPLPPAEIKKRAAQIQLQAASTGEILDSIHPQQEVIDDGANIQVVPKGNKLNPSYPSVQRQIPTGTQVRDESGTPRVLPPQQSPPVSFANPAAAGLPATTDSQGRAREFFAGDGRGGEPAAPAAPPSSFKDRFDAAMAGAPRAGLAPGEAEAASSTGQNSAAIYNKIANEALEVPAVRGVLNNIERVLPQFTSGPWSDAKLTAKAFANTVVPKSWQKEGSILDPKSIASQEEFNKFAYQLAQQQFQQLGGTGTDAKLNSTMSTSPSQLLSTYGNQGIVRILKGNNDALEVRAKEANKYRKQYGNQSANDFVNDFNQHFDPRVFQFKYIPKAERQSWYKSMSPEERQSFKDSADYALAKGWIKG